ncbi:MAG: pyrroline-5-carboxylate reductase dimerization domain-containing protein, partial [Phycisphaerales bacterium]|nr:pyrroline-5-carboxylate reductase dimerization domain-containing protein [Phycisphaerales bacterium]
TDSESVSPSSNLGSPVVGGSSVNPAIRSEAIALGLPKETADTLIDGMVEGAAAMMSGSDLSPAELGAAVTTPGGTTEAGLATMRAAGFVEAVRGGVAAACQRGEKLAQ